MHMICQAQSGGWQLGRFVPLRKGREPFFGEKQPHNLSFRGGGVGRRCCLLFAIILLPAQNLHFFTKYSLPIFAAY
jgi:hypothetical protein